MRKKWVVANWKLNLGDQAGLDFLQNLTRKFQSLHETNVIVAPPFTILREAHNLLSKSQLQLASQNVSHEERGGFTGEVSAEMLKEAGVSYAICGHSERRQFFHETSDVLSKKLKLLEKNAIRPVFCIGESLEVFEKGETIPVLKEQLNEVRSGLTSQTIIAYEPIWAIGTGKTPDPQHVSDLIGKLKIFINELVPQELPVLYGGSVNAKNIMLFLRQESIDGALIGGASLKFDELCNMVHQVEDHS